MQIILFIAATGVAGLSVLLLLIIWTLPNKEQAQTIFGTDPKISDIAAGRMGVDFSAEINDDRILGFGVDIDESGDIILYPNSTVSSHAMHKLLQN